MMKNQQNRDQLHFNTGLYWFTNDLRVEDNAALLCAAEKVQQLICVYTVDTAWFKPNRYGRPAIAHPISIAD